jgi:hypothetical protein
MYRQSQWFVGAPKEIERKFFHSTHENRLIDRHVVFSHAQLGRVGGSIAFREGARVGCG